MGISTAASLISHEYRQIWYKCSDIRRQDTHSVAGRRMSKKGKGVAPSPLRYVSWEIDSFHHCNAESPLPHFDASTLEMPSSQYKISCDAPAQEHVNRSVIGFQTAKSAYWARGALDYVIYIHMNT